MSLDVFSVVVAFLAALEAVLGGWALALGLRELRAAPGPAAEARRPLLALVAAALAATALAGVPLFYLLLASWVPRWPEVMCVEGVRRIGTGTVGPSRFLPALHGALDATKVLVAFLAGAWLVLRRTPAARGAALAAAAFGAVGVLDGSAALACVAIPKQEIFPEAGCCTVASPAEMAAAGPEGRTVPGALAPGFVAAAAALAGGALLLRRRPAAGTGRTAALAALAALAAASLPLASRFLDEVAAPALLGMPLHHCRWCAFAHAPESIAGSVAYLGAVFAPAWAFFARLACGDGGEAEDPGPRLLGLAAMGFLGAAVMAAVTAWPP